MKIEIPGYGDTTIEELKADIAKAEQYKLLFGPYYIQGLINKIEELQSDISALESEMDKREIGRHWAIHNS